MTQPVAYAFRMYRNYDGAGSGFGDTSVQASSALQDVLSVYAAQRGTTGALTIMVINKTFDARLSTLTVTNVPSASDPAPVPVEVWRYSAANTSAIVRQPDTTMSAGTVALTYPQSSITLIVLPYTVPVGLSRWGICIGSRRSGETPSTRGRRSPIPSLKAASPRASPLSS